MSPRGLRAFVDGTEPHPATRRKLIAWYLRRAAERKEETTAEVAGAALALLNREAEAGE